MIIKSSETIKEWETITNTDNRTIQIKGNRILGLTDALNSNSSIKFFYCGSKGVEESVFYELTRLFNQLSGRMSIETTNSSSFDYYQLKRNKDEITLSCTPSILHVHNHIKINKKHDEKLIEFIKNYATLNL